MRWNRLFTRRAVPAFAVVIPSLFLLPLAAVPQGRSELPYRVVAGSPTHPDYGWERVNDGSLVESPALASSGQGLWPYLEIELADSLCIGGFDLRTQPPIEIASVLRTTVCDTFVAYYLTRDAWGRTVWNAISAWPVKYEWLTQPMVPRFSFPAIRARRLRIEFHPADPRATWLFVNEFKVFSPPPPRIVKHWLADAIVGKDFTDTLRVVNLPPPLSWSTLGLPEGIDVDPNGGIVRWRPARPGVYQFQVMVQDSKDPSRMDMTTVYLRCLDEKLAAVIGDSRYANSSRHGMVWLLKTNGIFSEPGIHLEAMPVRRGVATVPAYSARERNFYVLAGDSVYALIVHDDNSTAQPALRIPDPQLNAAGSLLLSSSPEDRRLFASRSGDAGLWVVDLETGSVSREQPFNSNFNLMELIAGWSAGRGAMVWYIGITPLLLRPGGVLFDGLCRLDGGLQDAAVMAGRFYALTRSPVSPHEKPGLWVAQLGPEGELPISPHEWHFVPIEAPYQKGVTFPVSIAPWPTAGKLLVGFSYWDTLLVLDANRLTPVGQVVLDSAMVRRDMTVSSDGRKLFLSDFDNHRIWVCELGEFERSGFAGSVYARYWDVGAEHNPARIAVGVYSPAEAQLRVWGVAAGPGDTVRVLPILRIPEQVFSAEFTLHYDTTWLSFDRAICPWDTAFIERKPGEITLRIIKVPSWMTSQNGWVKGSITSQEVLLADLRFGISRNARFGSPLEFVIDRARVVLQQTTREVAVAPVGAARTYVGSGLGDLDHDGQLTLLDVQRLSSYLLGKLRFGIEDSVIADLNRDHKISLEDLWLLLGRIQPPGASALVSEGGLQQIDARSAAALGGKAEWVRVRFQADEPLFALSGRLVFDGRKSAPEIQGIHAGGSCWLDQCRRENGELTFLAIAAGNKPIADESGLVLWLRSAGAVPATIEAVGIGPRGVELPVSAFVEGVSSGLESELVPDKAGATVVPNPTNEAASFVVRLPGPSRVTVKIFDARGRCVRILRSESLPAGTHRLRFDGRGEQDEVLPSGVYLCRVETDFGAWLLKVTLLK